jgi:uncharacterized protein YgbK (DUF1537 family)
MARSRKLGIVADDLTGAVDTAGSLAAIGLSTKVSLRSPHREGGAAWEVLCCNTQTRNLVPSDVVRPVREATRFLVQHGYPQLYKKVDSTMRGNVGLETTTMLDASGASLAMVAPAFPEMGRTQRDGVLYVGDVPLEQAAEGMDPFGKTGSSSVIELLRQRSGRRVGLVDLRAVDSGEAEIERRILALVSQGCTLVAFDAVSQQHLRRIEAVFVRSHPDALLVGSAGLASAVAGRIAGEDPGPLHERGRVADAPFVLVSGSLNRATLAQLEPARSMPGMSTVLMDSDAVLRTRETREAEIHRVRGELRAAVERGKDVCLSWRVAPTGLSSEAPPGEFARLSRGLNEYLHELMIGFFEEVAVSGLVAVGGDTAHSVLTGLGAEGIVMELEVMPGVSMGTILGGEADSRFVTTKAGGFGGPDTLVRLIEYLRSARRR